MTNFLLTRFIEFLLEDTDGSLLLPSIQLLHDVLHLRLLALVLLRWHRYLGSSIGAVPK